MTTQSTPKSGKMALKIVFFTLFLDLIGFSIIFPLFPELIKYYLEVDGSNPLLRGMLDLTAGFATWGGAGQVPQVVLFGGILAGLYSLLQFFFAPIWGKLSDRIGRKPILLLSLTGLAASYVFWFFAGSFTLLIIGRIVGGLMAGNISTATAVVGDVTTKENRSKGMALIGIAFGLGFILGPAIGGLSAGVDLSTALPWTGVNPFSLAALIAFCLTLINVFMIATRFEETLPAEKRGQNLHSRTANPAKLFRPLPFKGVNLTNFAHFFFLLSFAGMEFTLTFLAHDRFGYTARDNAWMFVFTGVILALVQGGFVRRRAHKIGEQRVAIMGLAFLFPGMLMIGYASSEALLFGGLALIAIGAAMMIPCLTALASLYSPSESQGTVLGIFRSLGALSRVLGPIVACTVYWRWGSEMPYLLGGVFLALPLALLVKLPKTNSNAEPQKAAA